MLNRILCAAVMGGLMLSTAFAQSNNPPAAAPAPGNSATTEVVKAQTPDQWLASKFKGTDVIGSDGSKLATASDILFDQNGKIVAYVISVGGIAGLGATEVALAPNAFQVVKGTNGGYDKLEVGLTEDQLKNAQAFQPYKTPTATTGSGNNSLPPR